MKKKIFSGLVLVMAILASTDYAFAQPGIHFLKDEPIEEVLKMAKDRNMPVFIDGYTKTCVPCKELDLKVFPLKEVGDYFNANFINVKYDLEEPQGIKVRERYADVVTGFPSLILLDQNGEMVHKMGGFHPPDSLITKMSDAMKGESLREMRKRLQYGEKSVAFVARYKQMLDDGYLREELAHLSEVILNRITDQEMLDPKMWALVGHSVTDPYSPAFAKVVKNYWAFYQRKTTDAGFLEFQLRNAIQIAADKIVVPMELEDKIVVSTDPKKEAILKDFINVTDRFKKSETIRARFYVHDMALKGNWNEMVRALDLFGKINALGGSNRFTYQYIGYMMQTCRDKKVLAAAASLIALLPKEKLDIMDTDDNYTTLIRLYQLIGDGVSAKKYKLLQK